MYTVIVAPTHRELLRPHEVTALLKRFRDKLASGAAEDGGTSEEYAQRVISTILKVAERADPAEAFVLRVADLPKAKSSGSRNYSIKTLQAINGSLGRETAESATQYTIIAHGHLSSAEKSKVPAPKRSIRRYYFLKKTSTGLPDTPASASSNSFRVGFLYYPPLIDFNESIDPKDLYYYLFSLVRDEFQKDTGLQVVEQSVASVDAALRLITADERNDSDHLDCIFGIFETPARIRKSAGRIGDQSAFHAIMHTVSLKAVARADSPSKSFSKITADPKAEFHCVSGEVGAEFVTEILQYYQNNSTLSFDDPHNRIKVRPPVEDLGVLMNELQYHRNSKISRVAFIDGVTATLYMNNRMHERVEDELCFLETPMPSYGNGIWIRPGLHNREDIVESLTRLSWKYRMSSEYIVREEELLEPFKDVVSAIRRPV